jgi:hypothetical protein
MSICIMMLCFYIEYVSFALCWSALCCSAIGAEFPRLHYVGLHYVVLQLDQICLVNSSMAVLYALLGWCPKSNREVAACSEEFSCAAVRQIDDELPPSV